ncbi:MAG: hypothetical protein GY803_13450 [Chloroflexi bacterium]|nr:hypothetical protein [Chloroflexota bacterium]
MMDDETIDNAQSEDESTAVSTPPTLPQIIQKWTAWHTVALLIIIVGIVLNGLWLTPRSHLWAWIFALGLMTAFTAVAGQGILGLWKGLLIDERNMISLSNLQFLLWTLLVLSAFLTAVLSNISHQIANPLSIAIPSELWVLLGISATSLVGSPLISNAKKNQTLTPKQESDAADTLAIIAQQKGVANETQCAVIKKGKLIGFTDPKCANWSDLFRGEEVTNGAHLDLSKVQMFFFTLILILVYGVALGSMFLAETGDGITAFPAIDDSMVALLSISHAGFLVSGAT